jgi:hypothetical protein
MKSLKFWVGIIVLSVVATACSKSKGGGAAPPPPEEQNYHFVGGVCYNEDDERVDDDYCYDDDDGSYNGGSCNAFIYYTDCMARTGYRVDCRNNALAVECQDPEAYAYPNEIVDCTSQSYDYNRYCSSSY